MPKVGADGGLPQISEVGSYIHGSATGLLTSVRCPPLMADWMPLYSHLVGKQAGMSSEEREAKSKSLEGTWISTKTGMKRLACVGGCNVLHVCFPPLTDYAVIRRNSQGIQVRLAGLVGRLFGGIVEPSRQSPVQHYESQLSRFVCQCVAFKKKNGGERNVDNVLLLLFLVGSANTKNECE
jgi:hypothetical protein